MQLVYPVVLFYVHVCAHVDVSMGVFIVVLKNRCATRLECR